MTKGSNGSTRSMLQCWTSTNSAKVLPIPLSCSLPSGSKVPTTLKHCKTSMKTIKLIGLAMFISLGACAQSSDLTQLILDIEKLTQLKGILSDMKTGYEIVD